jgi:nucleoside-diphosphate-sugar epimerase
MRILVTGISGRIGANLAQALAQAGHTVRGLVWARDRRPAKLAELNVELVEGTLTNPADVAAALQDMDAVYHLGAAFQGGGPFSNAEYFEINVRGTFNMLEAAAKTQLTRFVFASTDALYAKYPPAGVDAPIREDDFPLEPGGLYALTKQLGEELCRGYARTMGVPVTVTRFALTVAGDEILEFGQFYLSHWRKVYAGATTSAAQAVAAELDAAAAQYGERCLVVARDAQGRSFKKHIADVRDIVAGLLAVLEPQAALGEVFQLAAPQPFTWEEAVPYLAQRLGLPWVEVRLAGTTPTFYEFDLAKGRRLLGYAPRMDIRRMIDEGIALRAGQAVGVLPTHVEKRG